MVQRLQKTEIEVKGNKLLLKGLPFKVVFEVKLDNGFEIKDMTQKDLREFHKFINDTVYKNLTISQVDKLFLRKACSRA